ncbi:MAG: hypothetical protein DRI69_06155 [Bacteroidetes bacterium]|nr:MAG: hypothetical protein DRI69_06155 [Bacteroidota bacterium]
MRIILCIVILCFTVIGYGQSPANYSRVQVDLTTGDQHDFVTAGLDLEHGIYLPHRMYIGDLADWEIEQVRQLGFEVEILIENVMEHYANQNATRAPLNCQQYDYTYEIPENFKYGSMGGYLTYSEMIDELDIMANLYPELISVRKQAGTDLSHEGRKIEWVRISDNPNEDESEPEILYTALHHAREPMSLMQMMYYMWYVLENYDSDKEIKYLVNNTEMYFIPCINPDGYVYNETIAPDGGGNWRKNKRDNNNDGIFNEKDDGVDLNRNYAFQWGLDDEGSSAAPGSVTYRGDDPFSEPETRAVRDFLAEHNFSLALNYHAYGNFLLYPWGFDGSVNPDSTVFANFGDLLSSKSGYKAGTTEQTLGYLANGVAADWMYAVHDVIAVTPELGDADWGFWPPESEIVNLSNASLYKNLTLAHLAQKFAVGTEVNADFLTARQGKLDIMVKRFGLASGSLALTVESLSPELTILGSFQEVGFEMFEEEIYQYDYVLSSDAKRGEAYTFVIKIDNGFFEGRETVTKVFSTEELAFEATGESIDGWEVPGTSTWGSTDEESVTGGTSLTDSPYGFYNSGEVNEMILLDPIDLRNAIDAELQFNAKWDIEEIIDYAVVEASSDGVNFFTLCGKHATSGSIFQRTDEPIYDGKQSDWVHESISLADFLGGDLYIRFALYSDAFFELDGIYIDDLSIRVYTAEGTTSIDPIDPESFEFRQYPNPANQASQIQYDFSDLSYDEAILVVHDVMGHVIYKRQLTNSSGSAVLRVGDWPAGIYTTSVLLDGAYLGSQRLVVGH